MMLENNNIIVKVGTDIISIKRVKNLFNKFKEVFLNKILTKKEIKYCKKNNLINISSVAKRFAAKEAFVKAIGTGFGEYASFKDIEIDNNKNNNPILKYSKNINEYIYNTFNINHFDVDVSLSDDDNFAIAMVVLIGYYSKSVEEKNI